MKTTLGNGIVHLLFVYFLSFEGTHFHRYALLFSD